jgi:hypothetical protein
MMNTILTLILIGLSFTMGEIRYKAYSDAEGQYLVQYRIDTSHVAFENENGKHYEAIITVLELVGEDSIQVYQPLRGIYAEQECICDRPQRIVEHHRELNIARQ